MSSARIVLAGLAEELGQPFIADPKPGANSNIAADTVAKAAPDGYTLLITGSWFVINQYMENRAPLGAHAVSRPWPSSRSPTTCSRCRSVRRPSPCPSSSIWHDAPVHRLQYGSPGTGFDAAPRGRAVVSCRPASSSRDVQYKGAPPIIPDLVSGRLAASVLAAGNLTSLARSGKLRALATLGTTRGLNTPEVPTAVEQGFKDAVAVSWFGLHTPAGTPESVVQRLNQALQKVVSAPGIKSQLQNADAQVEFRAAPAFSRYLQEEAGRWAPVARFVEGKRK